MEYYIVVKNKVKTLTGEWMELRKKNIMSEVTQIQKEQ